MAYFGEGKGPIHVDNVRCVGTERSLADCVKRDFGEHDCRHGEDAGVICDYSATKASGSSGTGESPAKTREPAPQCPLPPTRHPGSLPSPPLPAQREPLQASGLGSAAALAALSMSGG